MAAAWAAWQAAGEALGEGAGGGEGAGLGAGESTGSLTRGGAGGGGRSRDPEYHYYARRLKTDAAGAALQPLDPCSVDEERHTHMGQGGGKLIARDSGMGPATTFSLEENHLEFQFSDFVTGIMRSFYGEEGALLRVLERQRAKAKAAWTNTHVDIAGSELLPEAVQRRLAELERGA